MSSINAHIAIIPIILEALALSELFIRPYLSLSSSSFGSLESERLHLRINLIYHSSFRKSIKHIGFTICDASGLAGDLSHPKLKMASIRGLFWIGAFRVKLRLLLRLRHLQIVGVQLRTNADLLDLATLVGKLVQRTQRLSLGSQQIVLCLLILNRICLNRSIVCSISTYINLGLYSLHRGVLSEKMLGSCFKVFVERIAGFGLVIVYLA